MNRAGASEWTFLEMQKIYIIFKSIHFSIKLQEKREYQYTYHTLYLKLIEICIDTIEIPWTMIWLLEPGVRCDTVKFSNENKSLFEEFDSFRNSIRKTFDILIDWSLMTFWIWPDFFNFSIHNRYRNYSVEKKLLQYKSLKIKFVVSCRRNTYFFQKHKFLNESFSISILNYFVDSFYEKTHIQI